MRPTILPKAPGPIAGMVIRLFFAVAAAVLVLLAAVLAPFPAHFPVVSAVEPGSEASSSKTKTLYVALGDSLARGVLAAGGGYVERYREWLAAKRYPGGVALINLGVSGWTTADLLRALRADERFRTALREADVITVDIGGNDLLHADFETTRLERALEDFRRDFPAVMAEIRALNGEAILLTMDLYDPYPEGSGYRAAAEEWLARFNQVIYDVTADRVYDVAGCAEVYRAFRHHEAAYTWMATFGDYHPNDLGHQVIADRLAAVTPRKTGPGRLSWVLAAAAAMAIGGFALFYVVAVFFRRVSGRKPPPRGGTPRSGLVAPDPAGFPVRLHNKTYWD